MDDIVVQKCIYYFKLDKAYAHKSTSKSISQRISISFVRDYSAESRRCSLICSVCDTQMCALWHSCFAFVHLLGVTANTVSAAHCAPIVICGPVNLTNTIESPSCTSVRLAKLLLASQKCRMYDLELTQNCLLVIVCNQVKNILLDL